MRPTPFLIALALAAIYLYAGLGLIGYEPDVAGGQRFRSAAQSVAHGNTSVFFRGTYADTEEWFQPFGIYTTAVLQAASVPHPDRVAPLLAGAVNFILVFLIANHVTRSPWVSISAAVFLRLTFSHSLFAIEGGDTLYPSTLTLLWVYGVLMFLRWDSQRALTGAAIALGVCVYSHPSGPITALLLWLLTLAILWRRNRLRLTGATFIFGAMWIPAAAWFFLHPDTYPETFGRWLILKAHLRNPLDGLTAFINLNTLGSRASLYWGFWNPASLFLGTPSVVHPITAIFIALALIRIREIPRDAAILLIAALLVVPLAGATFGVPRYYRDAAAVLPLMAIVAALGVDQLVALVRRRPLEDHESPAPVEGWHSDDIAPRS